MREVSRDNFGLLIAYLVPGFVVLWGLRPYLGEGQAWFGTTMDGPTVGGFLYGTVASTAAGLIVSAVRWAVVDWFYHHTGIREPHWDFSKLSKQLPAFETLVEYHYRYYQFHGLCRDPHKLYYADRGITRRLRSGPFPSTKIWAFLANFRLRKSP